MLYSMSYALPCGCLLPCRATSSDQLTSLGCAEILPIPDLGDKKQSLKELADKIEASGMTPINYFTRTCHCTQQQVTPFSMASSPQN